VLRRTPCLSRKNICLWVQRAVCLRLRINAIGTICQEIYEPSYWHVRSVVSIRNQLEIWLRIMLVPPMERVHLDFMEPLPKTTRGDEYVLMMVDQFTKSTECIHFYFVFPPDH
jgi:hypothetical protein